MRVSLILLLKLFHLFQVLSNIAQAIKAAKRYNELREASKLSPKVISELQTERNKKGDGFEKF